MNSIDDADDRLQRRRSAASAASAPAARRPPRAPAGRLARRPSRGLLVRPRASTTPTAFPRCLFRRLRFVWPMPAVYGEAAARARSISCRCGVEARHRDVGGEVGERRLRRAGDELGAGHRRVAADGGDHLRPGSSPGGPRCWSSPGRRPTARAARRARARTAAPPPRPRGSAAAMRFGVASVAGGSSSTLKATSGGRAATSVAPAVGCARGAARSPGRAPPAPRRRDGAAAPACARRRASP